MKQKKQFFKKYKKYMILVLILIVLMLISPFINLLLKTEAPLFSDFLGFVNPDNEDAWISFWGSIIGGCITLGGVAWTILDQNKKYNEEFKNAVKPILVSKDCASETIRLNGKGRVIEYVLTYKNVGKGILYNPRMYNLKCSIGGREIDSLQPTLLYSSCIDIGETVNQSVMIILDFEKLQEIYQTLKEKENTTGIKIIMYVGGQDIYGRCTVTRFEYRHHLTFYSLENIELPLQGKLTSCILFNEEEISKIVNNANSNYYIDF